MQATHDNEPTNIDDDDALDPRSGSSGSKGPRLGCRFSVAQ